MYDGMLRFSAWIAHRCESTACASALYVSRSLLSAARYDVSLRVYSLALSPADEIKCCACGRIFHDIEIFIKHRNDRCKDNAEAGEPDEVDQTQCGAPGEYWGWEIRAVAVEFGVLKFLSPTEPPEKRMRLEEDRKVVEAQGGCGKCKGCSRTKGMCTVSEFHRA